MEEVEYLCERIAILNHGKMIALGTKEELVDMVSNENDDHLTLEEVFIRLTGKEFHLEAFHAKGTHKKLFKINL